MCLFVFCAYAYACPYASEKQTLEDNQYIETIIKPKISDAKSNHCSSLEIHLNCDYSFWLGQGQWFRNCVKSYPWGQLKWCFFDHGLSYPNY